MKRRIAVLAIGFMTMGTTSAVLAAASAAPAGAVTNCSNIGNKFRVSPNPAVLTTTGDVTKTFDGRCLIPNAQYILHDPACNFGADVALTTDFSGVLVHQRSLSVCTPGTYYTTLTEDFGAHKVYLVKERLTSPKSCVAGAPATITAVPNNAPRQFGTTVEQTLVGECLPAFAGVKVNFTACGGGGVSTSTDAFGRVYVAFASATCFSTGSFPLTVTALYPPVGSIVATGTQKIDP